MKIVVIQMMIGMAMVIVIAIVMMIVTELLMVIAMGMVYDIVGCGCDNEDQNFQT
jgi:hypothetical protein